MPGSRSEVSDGLPFFSVSSMAAKELKLLLSDSAARKQGVTPKPQRQQRSRSEHGMARDSLSPVQAINDGLQTPTDDVERKKLTRKTKKAGEGSSSSTAPTAAEGPKTFNANRRSNQKEAGDGSSNTRAIVDSKETATADTSINDSRNDSDVDEGASQPPPGPISYHKLLAELNTLVSLQRMGAVTKRRVHSILGQVGSLVGSLKEENIRLRTENKVLREVGARKAKSYSAALSTVPQPRPLPQTIQRKSESQKYTVFVSADGKDAKAVQKILTTEINPTKEKIQIKNMRNTKNLVIVETGSREDAEKLMKNTKLERQLVKVEPPRKRNPLVILYDVNSTLTEDEVKKAIYAQNMEDAISSSDFERGFRVKFKTGPRGRATVHIVCEVSPQIRKLMVGRGRTFIGFSSHSTKDYVVVQRCLTCQDLGHIKKHCQRDAVCSHCGEKGHEKANCGNKETPARCIPCSLRNKTCAPNVRDCPTYHIMMERLIDRTDYG